ncbi:MAG: hypothetical protein WAT09_03125 [Paracoccaceae bacterium]
MSARMLLVLMKLMFPLMGFCGYLAFDFWNVNRMARFGDGDGVTVGEYIGGWVSLGAAVGGGNGDGRVLPTELLAMMPAPPEGWTVRPTQPDDVDAYLQSDADDELTFYIHANLKPRGGTGMREARQTYESGPRKVVVEIVRYPDFVFTSFAATQTKMELGFIRAKYQGAPFMTVRGMEFTEDLLPKEAGLRYFFGNVSAQIWVRVLAPRAMTDQEMLTFFKTLHVPAMNAMVVDKVAGMGEVPVIVLASAIEAETRQAWEAERSTEQTEKERKRAEEKAAQKAVWEAEEKSRAEEQAKDEAERQQKADDRAKGVERDEDTGVKVRKGTGDGSKKTKKSDAGFGQDGCKVENGRKICGAEQSAQD